MREVIYREAQELQPDDLNNSQAFKSQMVDAIVKDTVGDGLYFADFPMSTVDGSNWKLRVGGGRRYYAGLQYINDEGLTHDFFGKRPTSHKKIAAIVAWGETVETDTQERDFEIDSDTGQARPQAVDMIRIRRANIAVIIPDGESPSLVPPAVPADNVHIANVTLTSGGIDSIEYIESNRVPQNARMLLDILDLIDWRALAGTSIDRLRTDLLSIADRLKRYVTLEQFSDLRDQIAAVREIAERADVRSSETSYSLIFSEHFFDESGSDTAASGYAALIEKGLKYPIVREELAGGIALFNANDPNVKVVDGFMTPKMTPKLALSNAASFDGDVSLQAYSVADQNTSPAPSSSSAYRSNSGSPETDSRYSPLVYPSGGATLQFDSTRPESKMSDAALLAKAATVTKGGVTYKPSSVYRGSNGQVFVNYAQS